jgi:colanic acid/amylovoran biosynthesis glycosyltransferase
LQNNKLHIALVVESFPTFSETFITNKVLYLCKQGHKVSVIRNSLGHEKSLVELYKLHSIPNLNIIQPAIPKTKFEWVNVLLTKPIIFLKSIILSNNFKDSLKNNLYKSQFANKFFDIVHFEFSGIGIAYQSVIEEITAIKIVSCRGTAEKVKPLENKIRQQQLSKLFSSVNAIHCVSTDMQNTIQPYNNANTFVFVNRPSINVELFKRKDFSSIKNKTIKLLSIGRFTFQKGYTIGLQVASKLKKEGIQFEWNIVGDGPIKEELVFGIHALNLTTEINLLGKKNRDEVLELYSHHDIFFLPSVYEGIANVVLEAMAMELPVISTKSGGLEEVIDHKINGMLANIYDGDELFNCILYLLNNVEERNKMGKEARKRILEQFTLERQTKEFEIQYTNLLKNKK